MIERKHEKLAAAYVTFDVAMSLFAMLVAWWLRFDLQLVPLTKGSQQLDVYVELLPLVMAIFPLAFSIQGLYRFRPSRGRAEELIGVVIGTLFGTVVLSGLLLWIRPHAVDYSRATLALFALCEVVLVMSGRLIVRAVVERRHRAGKDLDRVLIAGSGELAAEVIRRISSHRELGLQIVGYIDGDRETFVDIPRLGALNDVVNVVREHRVDHVFVALPHSSSQENLQLLDTLMRECIATHVVPDLLQFMALRSRVEDIEGLPTINLLETPLAGWSLVAKRLFDIAIGGLALLLLSPLLALIALLIWLEDRGPILYRQVRMGLDARPFEILKFRSMRVDAESQSGAVWAEKNDSRRTKIGEFIRTWSLDELPQLWNVLRGDMSLVGPRPERPQFVEQFRSEYRHYMLRHKVRAGMTGWAQVNGWRGNTSIRMRIEHDLYYIENWSLLLDLKILLMTVRHGFRHENAY